MAFARHSGRVEPVPMGLVHIGPVVEVKLRPPAVQRASQVQHNGIFPEATIKLLVDTGAQRTVIEQVVLESLGLTPISMVPIVGVSQVPEDQPVYYAEIALGMGIPGKEVGEAVFEREVVGVESPRRPNEHKGLLGRDFLRFMDFHYHGNNGTFEIVSVQAVAASSVRKITGKPQIHPSQKKHRR